MIQTGGNRLPDDCEDRTLETLGTVLPIYFVADESASMGPHVGEMNDALDELLAALHEQPFAASKARFSIIGFSDQARLYLPPADVRDLTALPQLTANSVTEYSAVFELLSVQIPYDVQRLKDEGYSVARPAVYFLTDGMPTDTGDWQQSRDALLRIRERPNILAFGIGDAERDVIRQVATNPGYAFIVQDGTSVGPALKEFFGSFTQSIIQSGTNVAAGINRVEIEKPNNFIALDVDVL